MIRHGCASLCRKKEPWNCYLIMVFSEQVWTKDPEKIEGYYGEAMDEHSSEGDGLTFVLRARFLNCYFSKWHSHEPSVSTYKTITFVFE